MKKPTNTETHKNAVEYVACNLIETNIPTRAGPGHGIDLILDNDETILVRGMSNELTTALINGSIDQLKTDYLIVATNQKSRCNKKIYIMTIDEAKRLAENSPTRITGRDNWFISAPVYREYRENYDILR